MKPDIDKYNIAELTKLKESEGGFHAASSEHVRIQFVRLDTTQSFGPLRYGGEIIVTCYQGSCVVVVEDESMTLRELDQMLVRKNLLIRVHCDVFPATIQLIWAPPFENVEQ